VLPSIGPNLVLSVEKLGRPKAVCQILQDGQFRLGRGVLAVIGGNARQTRFFALSRAQRNPRGKSHMERRSHVSRSALRGVVGLRPAGAQPSTSPSRFANSCLCADLRGMRGRSAKMPLWPKNSARQTTR